MAAGSERVWVLGINKVRVGLEVGDHNLVGKMACGFSAAAMTVRPLTSRIRALAPRKHNITPVNARFFGADAAPDKGDVGWYMGTCSYLGFDRPAGWGDTKRERAVPTATTIT